MLFKIGLSVYIFVMTFADLNCLQEHALQVVMMLGCILAALRSLLKRCRLVGVEFRKILSELDIKKSYA